MNKRAKTFGAIIVALFLFGSMVMAQTTGEDGARAQLHTPISSVLMRTQ